MLLRPYHGTLLESAVMAMDAEYRRNGQRGVEGLAELVEVARQLRQDGARLVIDPHDPSVSIRGQETPRVAMSGHRVTGPAGSGDDAGVPHLLSRQEMATAMGISARSLDRRVAEGTITARRVGRRVLFDPSAITEESPCIAS